MRRHQYPLASDWHSARRLAVKFVLDAPGGDERVGMVLVTHPFFAASVGLPHMAMSPERYLNLHAFVSKRISAELNGRRVLTWTKAPLLPAGETSRTGLVSGAAPWTSTYASKTCPGMKDAPPTGKTQNLSSMHPASLTVEVGEGRWGG